MQRNLMLFACAVALLAACDDRGTAAATGPRAAKTPPTAIVDGGGANRAVAAPAAAPFAIAEVASFDEPWAMAFLPDGRLLVTEKKGHLKLLTPGDSPVEVSGAPTVDYGGQGGFGDVAVHPDFAKNGWLYLSYVERGDGDTHGAVVARAHLDATRPGTAKLEGLAVVWRQTPKMPGNGHFGHRIAFGPDGKLWISSGERQSFDPAQDMGVNLGKIIRLNDDGTLPGDNPWFDRGGVTAQAWTLGHRNPLGLAFDAKGRLWEAEMGPKGGDELNLIERGKNYGWPKVSNGNNYDGSNIPDHSPGDGFEAPKLFWNPVIAPSDLIIYSGKAFPDWQGNALLSGLASQALVRVEITGDTAREAARYDMGHRIREVEQGPDGNLWLLEDGEGGRLLKLTNLETAE